MGRPDLVFLQFVMGARSAPSLGLGYAIDLEGLRSGSARIHRLDTVERWPLGRRAVSLTPQLAHNTSLSQRVFQHALSANSG